jgi:pimeloyl-ACP methyl ester carboxylesterase
MTAQDQRTRTVDTADGVRISVTEAGEAGAQPTVVLVHGFPDLSYTWRRQIPALAAAGYHVLAPDGRGYGQSGRPDDVEAYDIDHLVGDLLALLDDVDVERAVFVGHDWGALVVWALALMARERVTAAAGLGVPFLPRGTVQPTTMLRQFAGEQWFLLLWVQDTGVAERDMERDVERTIRRMFTGLRLEAVVGSQHTGEPRNLVDRLADVRALPDWFGHEDLAHYVATYRRTGFTGGLNWFRNFDRNWTLTPHLAGARIAVPTLYISGSVDPLLIACPPALMEGWVDDHRGTVLIDGAAHWVHQQQPDAVNDALRWFLSDVAPATPATPAHGVNRPRELEAIVHTGGASFPQPRGGGT